MTNPPFGGEEERGILRNFPDDKQTTETALLFLQLIMRKLKRSLDGNKGGRCGIVVPNGTLFATGIGARIKEELVKSFNLHTIVRLPNGVFAPYTGIQTNLLFFEKNGPTKEIWYYEHPLPPERQKMKNPCYTKSKPLRYEEFEPLERWWNNREENEHAWKMAIEKVIENDYNLDIKNPNFSEEPEQKSPNEVMDDIMNDQREMFELLNDIRAEIRKGY